MTTLKRSTPSKWWLQEQPEFGGPPIGHIVWHDCPYDENEMFAVNLECELCKSSAPDFIQLAVKLGQAHTVATMLSLQDYRLGWTIQDGNTVVVNQY